MTDFQPEEPIEQIQEAFEMTPEEAGVEDQGFVDGEAQLIVVRNGAETEDVFPVRDGSVIGRFDPSIGPIDIDLGGIPEGVYVSRKHAKFTCEDGTWKVQDLGSSNGTFLLRDDYERIEEADLSDGAELAFGNAKMKFRLMSS